MELYVSKKVQKCPFAGTDPGFILFAGSDPDFILLLI
jgi:hypothetical protein